MPFVKGDPSINRKGRPKNAEPELLRQALAKEGLKRGVDFWDKVAEYAYTDKNVMVAIIKKFVPDMTVSTIEGMDMKQIVVMGDIKKNDIPLRFNIGEELHNVDINAS